MILKHSMVIDVLIYYELLLIDFSAQQTIIQYIRPWLGNLQL